jgi:hypothetical protein
LKSSTPKKFLDLTNRAFLKKTTKELVYVIRHEWLEELELSTDIIFVAKFIETLFQLFII